MRIIFFCRFTELSVENKLRWLFYISISLEYNYFYSKRVLSSTETIHAKKTWIIQNSPIELITESSLLADSLFLDQVFLEIHNFRFIDSSTWKTSKSDHCYHRQFYIAKCTKNVPWRTENWHPPTRLKGRYPGKAFKDLSPFCRKRLQTNGF